MNLPRFTLKQPIGILTGRNDTFLHLHGNKYRKRDTSNLFNENKIKRN